MLGYWFFFFSLFTLFPLAHKNSKMYFLMIKINNVWILSLSLALALECWKCLSLKEKYCGDPFDTGKIVQENGPQQLMQCQTKCMKVKAHGKFIELCVNVTFVYLSYELVKKEPRNLTLSRRQVHVMNIIVYIFCLFFFFSFTVLILDPISRISIVLRGCVDYIDQFKKKCSTILAGSKIDFCEYCSTDRCNEASQFGPAALLVLIPLVIANVLLA